MNDTHAPPHELELARHFFEFVGRRPHVRALRADEVCRLADLGRLANVPVLDDGPSGRCDRVLGREAAGLVAETGSRRNAFRILLKRLAAAGCLAAASPPPSKRG